MGATALIVLMCSSICLSSSDTGCISGRYWVRGEQKFEYYVTLEPGGITVDADSNGIYCFAELSPGYYRVSIYPDSVEVVAGDTTFADYAHNTGYDSWSDFVESYQYELFFKINSEENISPDGFIIYGNVRGMNRLPVRKVNESVFGVRTPAGFRDFYWSLPGTPEQHLSIRDCPEVRNNPIDLYLPEDFSPPWSEELQFLEHLDFSEHPLAMADTEMSEWCSDDYSITHSVFNPKNSVSAFRSIDAGIAFPDDSHWLMWAAYKNMIVTMSSRLRFIKIDLPETVCRAFFSPSANRAVVIVREPYESRYVYAWYMINLESQQVSQFDPFPELDPQEERSHLEGFESNAPNARVYPADDGSLIIRTHQFEIRTYTPAGEQIQVVDLPNSGSRKCTVSEDCTGWFVQQMIDMEAVFTLGDLQSHSVLKLDELNFGPYVNSRISPQGNFIAFWGRNNGLWLYNIRNGKLRELLSSGRVWHNSLMFSADEEMLACKVFDSYGVPGGEFLVLGYSTTNVFDLSVPSDFMLTSYPDYSLVYKGDPMAVSPEGWVLMSLTERTLRGMGSINRIRVALLNEAGELVWLGHYIDTEKHFFWMYDRWARFSSDGEYCAFSDGDQIHLLRIRSEF